MFKKTKLSLFTFLFRLTNLLFEKRFFKNINISIVNNLALIELPSKNQEFDSLIKFKENKFLDSKNLNKIFKFKLIKRFGKYAE